jgi:TonB family protein
MQNKRSLAIVFAAAALSIGPATAQDQDGAYKVGPGISAPRVIERADPEYTEQAHAEKLEGTVVLSVIIMTDGFAHNINVTKKLGDGLDEKAVEAVQKWRFQPGMKDGVPVSVRATIEVNFRFK